MTAGEKLGPYEMLAQAGAGGMGEVWKARDTRLNRLVAIKFSKEHFSEYFEREAHAVAALNHPHICQLYDVGALPSGAGYLVMEYVEGRPVVSSEHPGPLPFDLALKLAIQMADALNAAHRKGVVHRDLKPANVLMTKSGIKILDFGLAQIEQPSRFDGLVPDISNLPPEQIPTGEMWPGGIAAGTLQYTSPEQLQGKATDARSDIFSFGALVYEMLSGKPAFSAPNAASFIAEVLKGPPPAVLSLHPQALGRIISRCLQIDPEERWQSAHDVQINLEWVALGLFDASPAEKSAATHKWWLLAAAAAVLAAALGAAIAYGLRRPAPARAVKLSLLAPDGATFVSGSIGGPPAVSPDGRSIAFVAEPSDQKIAGQQMLWVRALDSLSARELPGTEGARSPFWSPDNNSLGFFSQDKLKRIDLNGGAIGSDVQPLAGVPGGFSASGAWGPGGKILYAPSNLLNLFVISADGGQPSPATHLGTQEIGHFWPTFLPGGQRFLYSTQGTQKIYSAALGSTQQTALANAATHPVYVPAHGPFPEELLYIRDAKLTGQRFNSSSRSLEGDPHTLAEGIAPADFSVSTEGTLAYHTSASPDSELVLFDHEGKKIGSLGHQTTPVSFMRFSPDGKTVAIVHGSGKSQDIWLHDLARGVTSRFTFNGGSFPVWSPDGAWIVFRRPDGLYLKASDGSGVERLIYAEHDDPGLRNATDWSNDGHDLLLARTDPQTGFDMWLLPDPLSPTPHKLQPLLVTPANEGQGRFSSNPGAPRWVAYSSEESGTNEIYVIPMPGSPPGKWQISSGGGYSPRWAHQGRELYYIASDLRTVMMVAVEPGPNFRPGQPRALFKLPFQINGVTSDSAFSASQDGKTFLVAVPQELSTGSLNVVLNWQSELPE